MKLRQEAYFDLELFEVLLGFLCLLVVEYSLVPSSMVRLLVVLCRVAVVVVIVVIVVFLQPWVMSVEPRPVVLLVDVQLFL